MLKRQLQITETDSIFKTSNKTSVYREPQRTKVCEILSPPPRLRQNSLFLNLFLRQEQAHYNHTLIPPIRIQMGTKYLDVISS